MAPRRTWSEHLQFRCAESGNLRLEYADVLVDALAANGAPPPPPRAALAEPLCAVEARGEVPARLEHDAHPRREADLQEARAHIPTHRTRSRHGRQVLKRKSLIDDNAIIS